MTTETDNQNDQHQAEADAPELDPQALSAIRNLIEAETSVDPAPQVEAAPQVPAEPVQEGAAMSQPVSDAPDAHHEPMMKPVGREVFDDVQPQAAIAGQTVGRIGRLKARLLGYRPTPKHIMIAALVLLVLLRPWLVVGVVLLAIFTVICVFLILGYDGFWKRAMATAHWYARRRPAKAAELHRKFDTFALKWDGFLDKFPEGSVDGLYLPDFGELATADARHDEAMGRRLANLREGEA